jgi:hypothetical protein
MPKSAQSIEKKGVEPRRSSSPEVHRRQLKGESRLPAHQGATQMIVKRKELREKQFVSA